MRTKEIIPNITQGRASSGGVWQLVGNPASVAVDEEGCCCFPSGHGPLKMKSKSNSRQIQNLVNQESSAKEQ